MSFSENAALAVLNCRFARLFKAVLGKGAITVVLVCAIAGVVFLSFLLTRQNAVIDLAPNAHRHGAYVHMQTDATGKSSADRPTTSIKPLSCEKLQHVPGKSVTTVIVGFPPNAYSPAHRHPGSVTAFVLKGAVRSQLGGGPIETFKMGDTWYEPKGVLHVFAENASATEPAELLVVFIADDDCGPLVIPER